MLSLSQRFFVLLDLFGFLQPLINVGIDTILFSFSFRQLLVFGEHFTSKFSPLNHNVEFGFIQILLQLQIIILFFGNIVFLGSPTRQFLFLRKIIVLIPGALHFIQLLPLAHTLLSQSPQVLTGLLFIFGHVRRYIVFLWFQIGHGLDVSHPGTLVVFRRFVITQFFLQHSIQVVTGFCFSLLLFLICHVGKISKDVFKVATKGIKGIITEKGLAVFGLGRGRGCLCGRFSKAKVVVISKGRTTKGIGAGKRRKRIGTGKGTVGISSGSILCSSHDEWRLLLIDISQAPRLHIAQTTRFDGLHLNTSDAPLLPNQVASTTFHAKARLTTLRARSSADISSTAVTRKGTGTAASFDLTKPILTAARSPTHIASTTVARKGTGAPATFDLAKSIVGIGTFGSTDVASTAFPSKGPRAVASFHLAKTVVFDAFGTGRGCKGKAGITVIVAIGTAARAGAS
mmetsp:Transcript_17848/g.42106  ORF Transcript_17848/g.42106 Transcript_17848/m.42106 type:complete len:457 (+) Transcript_17848:1154-2524(+)